MSFATEVKKEILSQEDMSSCCKKAMVLGILQGASSVNITSDGIKVIVKNYVLNAIKSIIPVIKEMYHVTGTIKIIDEKKINLKRYYYLEIGDKTEEIINDFALPPFNELSLDHPFLINPCCQAAFIRGMFASRGSLNDPRKNCYHFEISCNYEYLADILISIFATRDIHASKLQRKRKLEQGAYIVYVKKSESISDCLALIGANAGVFHFEDSRIYRDFSNMANRMTNCDIANERKCLKNCEYQLEIITYLRKNHLFEKLPVRLQSIAKLREDYPDASYDELATFSDNEFGKSLSKSGIAHCMRDLIEFYKMNIK